MELWQLQQMQGLPLEIKVKKTELRIQEWVEHWGIDNVYISFSGGKDSTVLMHIARNLYPNIKGAFADTGLEYPELRKFVKTFENIDFIKPQIHFKEVVKQYGWNFPSKDVAECVYYARKGSTWALNKLKGLNNDGTHSDFKQRYKKFEYLIEAPFLISNKCCLVMKEKPFADYGKATGRKAIIGTMACESDRRKDAYLKTGCNAFEGTSKVSKPLSFWNEQDVLRYIKENDVPYCKEVYGDIVPYNNQYSLLDDIKLTTTKEQRTGCMFCPVGCHLEKENKYQRMKISHPEIYNYCMKPVDDGGLGLDEVLTYLKVKH